MMNNMNQFGNNLNAPYGQNDYSQFFYGKNQYGQQQQQQNMNNLLWVQGIEGAKAEQYHLNKVAVGYDIVYIIEEQDKNV